MYRQYYGFRSIPFKKDIKSDELLFHESLLSFQKKMDFLKKHGGIGVVWGNSGTGKSAGLRHFRDSLNKSRFRFYYVSYPPSSVTDFYRELALAMELRPLFRRADLFHQIQEHILEMSCNKHITPVIALDEAQNYHHTVLECLRMFLNFDIDSKDHAILLLSGQPELRKRLRFAVYEPLIQRITVQHQFEGLDRESVEKYIQHRLGTAGVKHQLFEKSAIQFIYQVTKGNMRKINNLAVKSMILGTEENKKSINKKIVEIACQDFFWS